MKTQALENDNFFNLGNDYFSLKGYSCFTGIDTLITNLTTGESKSILKVQANKDNLLYFAFSGSNGLCRTTPKGSIRKKNILNQLISLPNNIESLKFFFEENGFLFPISKTKHEEIDIDLLYEIINRIKATVLLISEIEDHKVDYEKILNIKLYLLFSNQVSLKLKSMTKAYSTCKHDFVKILENTASIPTLSNIKECDNGEFYLINDLIYGADCYLNIEEYQDIISGRSLSNHYPGIKDQRFKNIVYLYLNASNETKTTRCIIDFLFNLMKKVGIVREVSFDDKISFYEKPKMENFDEKLKQALIFVAKIVLDKEINSNLSGIKPSYMVNKMEPSWKADSLLSALYFSIFYIKPNSEIYRKCANPTCDKYFLVKTSNGRKRYCCANCRNATAQRNHRKTVKRKAAI